MDVATKAETFPHSSFTFFVFRISAKDALLRVLFIKAFAKLVTLILDEDPENENKGGS